MALLLRGGAQPIDDPKGLVEWYDKNVTFGPTYYRAVARDHRDTVGLEDLGYAVLFAGRPGAIAAKSLSESPIDISSVPNERLAKLDSEEIERVLDGIDRLVSLPGFGSSVATKVLHKKRPATIPVMDNMAIFQTYMDEGWKPGRDPWPKRSASVYSRPRIAAALRAIAQDVSDPVNLDAWAALEKAFPLLTRIEIFDKVWWAFARRSRA